MSDNKATSGANGASNEVVDSAHVQVTIAELQAQLLKEQEKNQHLLEQLDNNAGELSEAHELLQSLDEQMQETQNTYEEVQAQLSAKDAEIATMREHLQNAIEDSIETNKQMVESEEKTSGTLSQFHSVVEQLEAEVSRLREDLAERDRQVEVMAHQLELASSQISPYSLGQPKFELSPEDDKRLKQTLLLLNRMWELSLNYLASNPDRIAVPWMPDEEAHQCSQCGDDFSVFKRKHHCRLCALVYCGSCTSQTFNLPNLSRGDGMLVCVCVCGCWLRWGASLLCNCRVCCLFLFRFVSTCTLF